MAKSLVPGAIVCLALLAPAHAEKTIAPVSGPWDAGPFDFGSKKVRRSLSGIACSNPVNAPCLVVFDEGTQARYVKLSPTGYAIDDTAVALRDSEDELDAEGAATDGRYFYVAGSHSAKRKSCESNPGSRHVVRFAIDPKTGKADPASRRDTDALWQLMASIPELAGHVGEGMCLGTEPPAKAPQLKGKRGVNIEGLAVSNDLLYFGFRGPVGDGKAPVLSTDAKAFFEAATPTAGITQIEVGNGRGIRDLAAVKDGILVLAGPDDDSANAKVGWILGLWDGKPANVAKLKYIANLDLAKVELRKCDDELKPEALAVLRETADDYEVVIMSDGMCDGGPLKFALPRKD